MANQISNGVNFIKYSKIFFIFSGVLMLASVITLFIFGISPGIEFTGGSIIEVQYSKERPSNATIREQLAGLNLGDFVLQPTNEKGLILRTRNIDKQGHVQIMGALKKESELEELRFESIGPTIGQELREKTGLIVFLSLFSIVLYIAFSFRKIHRPLRSWHYGIASLLALLHDVLIPLGIFAVLGKSDGVQITIPVVVAFLTVLGYSINNTVVIFDRIRENLVKKVGVEYLDTVNKAINQNSVRCINTALTTLFMVTAIYFFGGETLKYFALALILGITVGTYSSIFLAGPFLVVFSRILRKQS